MSSSCTFFVAACHGVSLESVQLPVAPESEVLPCPLEDSLPVGDPARQRHVLPHGRDLVERLAEERLSRRRSDRRHEQEQHQALHFHHVLFSVRHGFLLAFSLVMNCNFGSS